MHYVVINPFTSSMPDLSGLGEPSGLFSKLVMGVTACMAVWFSRMATAWQQESIIKQEQYINTIKVFKTSSNTHTRLYVLPSISCVSEFSVASSKIPTMEQTIYSSFHSVYRYTTSCYKFLKCCTIALEMTSMEFACPCFGTGWSLSETTNKYFLHGKLQNHNAVGKMNVKERVILDKAIVCLSLENLKQTFSESQPSQDSGIEKQ